VHKLRSEEAAILVGTETALSDNPQLNVRHYFGLQPLRLVLDRTLRLPDNLHLFDGTQPTVVFTEYFKGSEIENLEYIQIPFGTNDFLSEMLDYLHKRRIVSVLVEGGASLLNSFLASGLWDEAYILRSNTVRLESGIEAPQIQAKYFTERSILGEDYLEHYQHK
jgi:diaminohydroxyphosphoribosylaminopyrimidine deaminase/5-amino-6-(5-phosphoribosylamino)uracil reductase